MTSTQRGALAAAIIGIGVLVAAGTSLAPAPGVTTPAGLILELQGPWVNGSSAVLTVSYANIPTSPAAFLVSLAGNGSTSLAVPMPTTSGIGAGASVSPAGYPFRIDWTDVDRDGMVSTLDTFTITPTAAQPPCCLYETFYVLRRTNGSLVAQVGFYGIPSPGTRPAVSLDYVYQANLVNAGALAQERGLEVAEMRSSRRAGFSNSLDIALKTESDTTTALGMVDIRGELRILGIDDLDIDAPLSGYILFMRNQDVPGVIGRVGTILGNAKVNIANFALGRKQGEPGGDALGLVNVDSQVPESVLNELRSIPAIRTAKVVEV